MNGTLVYVKVQACVTWSSAKGTESPDLVMYCSNQAYLHASSFVLHLDCSWRIGESWFVAAGLSNRSVVSCLLEPSLPRNNRLAHHPTTLTSDEVRHVTSDIPLVAVGPFLLPRSAPTLPSLTKLANKPPGTRIRHSQPGYSVLPSALEAPPSFVQSCIGLRKT